MKFFLLKLSAAEFADPAKCVAASLQFSSLAKWNNFTVSRSLITFWDLSLLTQLTAVTLSQKQSTFRFLILSCNALNPKTWPIVPLY